MKRIRLPMRQIRHNSARHAVEHALMDNFLPLAGMLKFKTHTQEHKKKKQPCEQDGRNHLVGERLGHGETLAQIVGSMRQVAGVACKTVGL